MEKNKTKRTGRRLSIRAQLTAGIVILTLAGIGLISLFALKVIETRSVDSKVRQAVTLVSLIRIKVGRNILPGSYDYTDFVYSALKESGVKDFELKAPDGTVLLSAGKQPVDRGPALFLAEGIKVQKFGGGLFSGPGDLLHVSARLDRTSSAKGSLSFTLPMNDIKKEVGGVRLFLLLYAVIDSIIIILFGVYFFSKSITMPIKRLEEATARIASGAFDERVGLQVDNEVGRLAVSFNTMAARVEAEIKALEGVNSELVSAQENLLRTQTLAALGRMAAGIAHEVGNPLGAVQGYLEILAAGSGGSVEDKEIVRRTIDEVRRIDKILREFLDIARPSPTGTSFDIDVNIVVEETLATLSAHKEMLNVTVKSDLSHNLPLAVIDADKLRQVLVNLLLNAAQSMDDMEGERVIIVDTSVEKDIVGAREIFRRRKEDRTRVSTEPLKEWPEFVVVRITDHGHGVDEASAKKIFEPFFSTKEVGKGTGLGLFVSDMIIKAYKGSVLFDSVPGVGSTFTVLLPVGKPAGKE